MRAAAAIAATALSLSLAPAAAGAGKPWLPPIKRAGAVVWAVGDGADGGANGRAVGSLIASRSPDRFLYLGDVYDTGTAQEFTSNYEPLFGPLAPLTAPVIGNHEWDNRAQGYMPYWWQARGRVPRDWYSIKASGWQLIGLNTMAPHGPGSEQLRWLRAKLRRTRQLGSCRIAFMHHPRFSASMHGDHPELDPAWKLLRNRAVLALAGHEHNYQRFHPAGGITQVVAGSGGHGLYEVGSDPRLAFAEDSRHGAVRIELRGRRATLGFVGTDGKVLDRSAISCRR